MTAPKLPEGLEPDLPPDLEALMPEPFGYVPFAGEFYPPDELDAEVKNDPTVPAVYTATQMREAILAATERAAKKVEEVGPKEGALKLVTEGFAAAIRGDRGGV